jgi:GDP-mannose 4,6-dehydratase
MDAFSWHGRRVLITGISGFVGPYLARELVECGAEVYGLVRLRSDRALARGLLEAGIAEEVRYCEADLLDLYGVLRAVSEVRPDAVVHLAAQSFVRASFDNPLTFTQTNTVGTAHLLEALRLRAPGARVLFAGSSEEYGLVLVDAAHERRMRARYDAIVPPPAHLPEVPIRETNPLRPLSPYAASKVAGEALVRTYAAAYGLHAVTSRAFNHEGAGRGIAFVTSQIASQAAALARGELDAVHLGQVGSFRDWSHVRDVVRGYRLLLEHGVSGEVYNLASGRTASVLSFLLLALEEVGRPVTRVRTIAGATVVEQPAAVRRLERWGTMFEATRVDELMLTQGLEFTLADEGLILDTPRGEVRVLFDHARFRPSDVPILLGDASRSRALGFLTRASLRDIVRDQVDYYRAPRASEPAFAGVR